MSLLLLRRLCGGYRGSTLGAIVTRLLQARERVRQRRALAGLNDALLRDIGLTQRDVAREVVKPFWRQ